MDQSRVDEILKAQLTLPEYLRRDRTAIEADEQAQDLRRASFGRGRLNLAERVITRGAQLEQIALSNLLLARNAEDLEREQLRYSEGLEMQGRYIESANAHPHEEGQARLRAVEAAVHLDDGKFCDCPVTKTEVNGKAGEIAPQYEVKKVYSRKHGQMVSLVGCGDGCGHLNATPTPPTQLQAILRAHDAAGQSGKPMVHEHEVLGVKQSNS